MPGIKTWFNKDYSNPFTGLQQDRIFLAGKLNGLHVWHDGWYSFLWVWVPVRGFLCLFWHKTRTKGLHARFPMRLEEQKRRKHRSRQLAENRTGQSTEVGGSRLPEPVDPEAGFANMRSWISIPGDFLGISLEYTLVLAHRCTEC